MRTHGAVVGRRFRSVTKLTTKVRIGRGYLWESFLIAAAALKTPTRNGYNTQGFNLNFPVYISIHTYISIHKYIDKLHAAQGAEELAEFRQLGHAYAVRQVAHEELVRTVGHLRGSIGIRR